MAKKEKRRSCRPAWGECGDLWLLDRHRLWCGDPRDAAIFDLLLQDGRADLVFTDPSGCDQIVRRFEQVTGKQARLATTGQSFAAVAAARARDMFTTVDERLA